MRLLLAARNRRVGIEGDRIVAPEGRFDVVIDLPQADMRPGLINAHDHLHRNHYGRLGGRPYRSAYRWADDIQTRYHRRIAQRHRIDRRAALLAGAWKNLLAGVTTVVHHDPWEKDFEDDFPIAVARIPAADSIGRVPADPDWPGCGPFSLHLAEGTDARAAGEIDAAAARGLLTGALLAVHAVGPDRAGVERLRASGAAIVWCPSSNLFLFGRTAPAALLADGIDVLLGSDSLLTGAGDLLDELHQARALGIVADSRLEAAVAEVAARRLGLPAPSLDPGAPADLVILARPLLEARAQDVVFVVARGVPRVACPALAPILAHPYPGGVERRAGSAVRWTNPRPAQALQEGILR
jgi:cytosine/adenosine deaminase-related metal-dependent hydrolase